MDNVKLKQVMKAFILFQFNYYPLVWMFCERCLNDKIYHLYEKALRIAYKDDISDIVTLLERGNAVKIHIKNLQLHLPEIHKTHNNLYSTFMKEKYMKD